MRRRLSGGSAPDRGATAVEFALLLPVLLLLVFGIIDFGRALNAQITLTQAAREGARLDALGQTNSVVVSHAETAATGLTGVIATETKACQPNSTVADDAEVTVTYTFSFVTPVGAIVGIFGSSGLGSPITLTAQGVMPCET